MAEGNPPIKEKTIAAIRAADISEDDWNYDIIESIDDDYARGFIEGTICALNERDHDFHDEFFRSEFIAICNYDIWGKSKPR